MVVRPQTIGKRDPSIPRNIAPKDVSGDMVLKMDDIEFIPVMGRLLNTPLLGLGARQFERIRKLLREPRGR